MKPVYAVRCPYCFVPERTPCQTPSGVATKPHRLRIRSYERLCRQSADPLNETAIRILRLAADAWSSNAVSSAERLAGAAWAMYEGRDFVDLEASADA